MRAKVGFVKSITGNLVKDNGGTVYGRTSLTGSAMTAKVNPGVLVERSSNGHIPAAGSVASSGLGVAKSLSGGTFGIVNVGKYIILRQSTYIANVSNNAFRSGSSEAGRRKPIAYIESIRTTGDRAVGWNYVTGALLSTPSVSNDTFKSIDGGAVVDQAARPTKAVPGEFVYLTASKTPVQKDYPAKNM